MPGLTTSPTQPSSGLRRLIPNGLVWLVGLCATTQALAANPPTPAPPNPSSASPSTAPDFQREIRPLLERHCLECHGASRQKGGLRLDSLDGTLKGADSGPVIVKGDAAASRLFRLVSGQDPDSVMPPKGPRLDTEQLRRLQAWIDHGAPWPTGLVLQGPEPTHWSLQPLQKPAIPTLAPLPPTAPAPQPTSIAAHQNPIDAFVHAALLTNRLDWSAPANRSTLLRRVTFDLTGLPPSPHEIAAFLKDPAANAYETVVDRLLNSPRYGERWARHWLDIARYTESQGFEYDRLRDHAWHYRDYVIDSFNRDKPYDRFMREQIAGDALEPPSIEGIVATSFLVCGPWDEAGNSQANATQRAITREEEMEDLVGTVTQTFLGLTVNCARCHSHKFDPIPQEDYYRVRSVFDGVKHGERPLALPIEVARHEQHVAALRAAVTNATQALKALEGPAPKPGDEIQRSPTPAADPEAIEAARRTLAAAKQALEAARPPPASYTGRRVQPEPTRRLRRGDVRSPEEVLAPAGLSAISSLSADLGAAADAPEAQRRLKFAEWLADPRNPLPARVMVNRLWHWHFGAGLVATPSDFGTAGSRPTHPELLDWLAATLIEHDWRLKPLHRLIVTSRTYRQASAARPDAMAVDADAQWLWRFPPRRLDAESVRDAMLAASGRLNLLAGGPSFRPFDVQQFPANAYVPVDREEPAWNRRTIYRMNVNSGKEPLLDVFDCPDPSVRTPRRGVTTTPLQALALMNNSFAQRQAQHLATRVATTHPNQPEQSIRLAYQLTLGRDPTPAELDRALEVTRTRGLPSLCWALFNSTEFVYAR